MASYKREDTYGNGAYFDIGVFRKLRTIWEHFSLRIPNSWISSVWDFYCSVRRSSFMKTVDSKIRPWAYKNALTLLFLSVMFVITWGFLAVIIWRQ